MRQPLPNRLASHRFANGSAFRLAVFVVLPLPRPDREAMADPVEIRPGLDRLDRRLQPRANPRSIRRERHGCGGGVGSGVRQILKMHGRMQGPPDSGISDA